MRPDEASQVLHDLATEARIERFFVPPLGQEFELLADWKFTLYEEHRNTKFAACFGLDWTGWPGREVAVVTLPKGTRLKVDRYYIRQGASDYDSITFRCNSGRKKVEHRGRFWVKLGDVNGLMVGLV